MDNMKHRRLQELDRSDFEIVDKQPDIRGWDVKNTAGKVIGEVEELIIDAKQKKVRYMVIDLDDNELDLDDDRKVLLPIGLAELDEKEDDVIVPSVDLQQLRSLPAYDKDHLDDKVERQICSVLGRQGSTSNLDIGSDAEFYKHDYFNDDNLYRHRSQNSIQKESDYEKGLRLWERRSQGGILSDSYSGSGATGTGNRSGRDSSYSGREIDEEARMEMVRNRRNNYQQRRGRSLDDNRHYRSDEQSQRRDNSIEGRIRNEGLRDPDTY